MQASDRLASADRVAVYGLGREGRSAIRWIRQHCGDPAIDVLLDGEPDDATRAAADELGVALVVGTDAVVDHLHTADVDVLVRSPGVPLRGEGMQAARDAGVAVTTSTNLWFEVHAPDNVVAITGTKGKSTTSALLAHLLRGTGRDVALLGNIGASLLDHETPPDAHDVVVVELSSYQLADLEQPIPIGVWLNLHREHVDWHGSHEAYLRDKGRIVSLSRTLVANADDAEVADVARAHGAVRWVSCEADPVRLGDGELSLRSLVQALSGSALVGHHHLANLAAALTAGAVVGADPSDLLEHVASFEPLPHRLQLVHTDGRRWIDDSISTIPETAVAALAAFPDVPVTLLAGGHERQQDHAPLADAVAARDDVLVVAMPDTGQRLAASLRDQGLGDLVVEVDDLHEAVEVAADRTPRGGVVLLSPAAPSYGRFTSFEQRGDQFAELARAATDAEEVRR